MSQWVLVVVEKNCLRPCGLYCPTSTFFFFGTERVKISKQQKPVVVAGTVLKNSIPVESLCKNLDICRNHCFLWAVQWPQVRKTQTQVQQMDLVNLGHCASFVNLALTNYLPNLTYSEVSCSSNQNTSSQGQNREVPTFLFLTPLKCHEEISQRVCSNMTTFL